MSCVIVLGQELIFASVATMLVVLQVFLVWILILAGAALAGCVASPFGVGVHLRLRRSQAALAGCVAFLLGVGANPRLRRESAALAGCKASGCSQVDVELDSFSTCFQPCMSPTDRHRTVVARLLHQLAQIHAGLGMATHMGLCMIIDV